MSILRTQSLLWGVVLALGVAGCSHENPRVTTRFNQQATLEGELPFSPLQEKVITSWVDTKNAQMATLYGNDLAVQYARSHAGGNYPVGSVLSLVTWHQQEDERWFGGRIPAAPKSVEYVVVGSSADHTATYSYQDYEGQPLKKIAAEEGTTASDREQFLLSQRASVLP